MEWHDLEKMTVVKLREVAHESDIKAVHGKNKAQLIAEVAGALGIEKPSEELAEKPAHNKADLKREIRELKAQRNALIEAHDHGSLKDLRRKIHRLKRAIRKIHGSSAEVS